LSLTGLCFTIGAALMAAASNILLRLGLARSGGFGVSDQGIVRDVMRLACEPVFVAGLLLYALALGAWLRVLSTEALYVGYVLLISIAFIATSIGDVVIFRETMTLQKALGALVILAGIVVMVRA
jgi:multidrug transporter EmrE-like cation transporter